MRRVKHALVVDLCIVTLVGVAIFLVAVAVDPFDRYADWARLHGALHVDDLMIAASAIAITLTVLSWRRSRDLVRVRAEQVAASEAKAVFLSNMSHEVRTPMNGVVGATELLLRTELSGAQRDYAETVQRSAQHLLTVVSDMLDLSEVQAGKLRITTQDFDVRAIVEGTVEPYRAAGREKSLTLTCTVDDAVPCLATGDPYRFGQVLANLVDNAVKFTERGHVTVRIEAPERSDTHTELLVSVTDSGIGVSEDQQRRLFTAFSQADTSTTRSFGGTGLGLAICRGLVELMGGSVGLHSSVGVGSSFWFRLPLALPAQPARPAVGPAAPSLAAPVAEGHQRPRVLVVEDNAVNRQVATAMLTTLGYDVDEAADGRKALEAIAERRYAAVLMDVQMPRMDGYAATAAVRSGESPQHRLPVVALTANASQGDRERALGAGMDDYLAKPYTSEGLARVLERWAGPGRPGAPIRAAEPSSTGDLGPAGEPQAADEPESDEPVLDPHVLAQLRDLGGPSGTGLLERLVPVFLGDASKRLVTLEEAIVTADTEEVARSAHYLKGSSANLGARKMSRLCAELEVVARAGEVAVGCQVVDGLRAELDVVRTALEHELAV